MKITADAPGSPICSNIGLRRSAIHSSIPVYCMSVTANEIGTINFSSQRALLQAVGNANRAESIIFQACLLSIDKYHLYLLTCKGNAFLSLLSIYWKNLPSISIPLYRLKQRLKRFSSTHYINCNANKVINLSAERLITFRAIG